MGSNRFGAVIDLDAAADAVSIGMDFTLINGASFQVIADGTVSTTITLEANNNPARFPNAWVPVTDVEFEPIVSGSPAAQIVEVSKMRSAHYRVSAGSTSGSGQLRVVAHGKGD